jgi:hypothetical protein
VRFARSSGVASRRPEFNAKTPELSAKVDY